MTIEGRLTKLETSPAADLPGGFRTREAMLEAMRGGN